MSAPSDWVMKAPWLEIVMAISQGSVIASAISTPGQGRSRFSQLKRRSRTVRTIAVSPATIRTIGPLTRMPTPIAAQNDIHCQRGIGAAPGGGIQPSASPAIAATTVSSRKASVLACLASMPSSSVAASIAAPAKAASAPSQRRPIASVTRIAPSALTSEGSL